MKSIIRTACLVLGILTLAGAAVAQSAAVREGSGPGEPRFDPTQIVFKPGVGKVGLTLSVSGPDGYQLIKSFQPGVSPTFSVNDLADGLYSYELRIEPVASPNKSGEAIAGRTEGPSSEGSPRRHEEHRQEVIAQSGHFRMKAGSLVLKGLVERGNEEPLSNLELTGQTGLPDKDVCYVDDLIVDGSLCVGFDCTCNYSFGFDTIVLKENNLRIFFDDTSTTGSFPRNDWRIIINDSANGGASYFGIEDSSAGRRTFTIEAGAPTHSLYVDDGGRLGLGTSTPVVDIHAVSGNTPTLRLAQDGSSGFAPQTFDVAANETNFFIRDATSGSTLPFRIQPGAPSNVLTLRADGRVGMGTWSPDAPLHVVGNLGGASDNIMVVENTTAGSGSARLVLRKTNITPSATNDPTWIFNSNGTLRLSAGTDAAEFELDASGNLKVTGSYKVNGTTLNVPDYVFEPDYNLMPLVELRSFLSENRRLPNLPSAKDVSKNGLNMTEMQLGLLQKVEELTLYILAQEQTIRELEKAQTEAEQLHGIIEDLQKRLDKLESGTID